MKPGQGSQTAIWVCMARAMAHERPPVAKFSDPTARLLLPEDQRARVDAALADAPASRKEQVARVMLAKRTGMMVARTVEIDDAIRAAPHPQVVILGAGLDGRAWRMSELRDATVFEVDHPDTQRAKQVRASALTQQARAVKFVPVDFTRDSLDDALARAGHDPKQPTTWVWEGVVMYLTRDAIEATLAVVDRRSAPESRLVVAYMRRTVLAYAVGAIVRRAGEPFRSAFRPEQMRALLGNFGFRITRDESAAAIGAALSDELGRLVSGIDHLRIATADR
jgi:methyltransferase (TIGR00027 family)